MKNIVTIGGGTGSYTVLLGLKNLPDVSLTALVSMADDGGSTGILRKKWNVMPAGDVRQCLAALSGKKFLNYRLNFWFLKGHKVGNIFLAVFEKITRDFSRGLRILSFLFNVKGKIIPITKNDAILCVELEDGKIIKGESNIDLYNFQTQTKDDLVRRIYYEKDTKLNPIAKEAILNADYIIIGPGNMYCSIIPNLITEGFRETIKKSSAEIIFLRNLVNKQGHMFGWGAKKYLETIEKYLGKKVDIYLINNREFSNEQKKQYTTNTGEEIFIKEDLNDSRIIREDLLLDKIFIQNDNDSVKRSLIRHDSKKLAEIISKIMNK